MLGCCYYPEHWPEAWWADDAAAMRAMGLGFVRIGEFAWGRIEPARERWNWGWLDRAMETLSKAGLKIILGTPTATPPKWLVDEHPEILPVGADGRARGFGSRRHYTFASPIYRDESARFVLALARRYGEHPALVGWQTDNEYGCHDTTLSFGAADRAAFQDWLRHHYQDPAILNESWGNVFWSMEVRDFAEVELPNGSVTEANPAATLDFRRFASEAVAAYNRMQVEIIRAHSPGRFVTHNFMGRFHDFDHYIVAADLDLAVWDSYPLGFTVQFPFTDDEKRRWALTGHPDMAAFHHDLYRGVGRGRFGVMEQQPGPVNWAPWNPVPAPGIVRLWTWEALAHGAELVSYFRWRQAPFAQEQYHAGLQRPDRVRSPGGDEAARVADELAKLDLPPTGPADVALVFDYEAAWITRIQPQGADFDYALLAYRWYEALRRFGLDVDVVPADSSLDGYKAVMVPCLPRLTPEAHAAFSAYPGTILFGPRTGSKTRHFQIPSNLPPGELQDLLPCRVVEVSSLRPGLEAPVIGPNITGNVVRWRERIETGLAPLATFADGTPALLKAENRHYLAGWPDETLLRDMLRALLVAAGVDPIDLPEGVRLRRRGNLSFAFNYGPDPWPLPFADANLVLGTETVAPQDVACWR